MLSLLLRSFLIYVTIFVGQVCAAEPIVEEEVVFEEKEGILAVEAEHFFKQTLSDVRSWHLTHSKQTPVIEPDGDPSHVAGASGGAYLEILPDTRRTHGDKLIRGTNFSPQPGKMAVLHYKVQINNPGRYYVWVRAYSTGSEDNGLHVGLNGNWPATGQRLQWCQGKKSWRWESKQRTEAQHCGEPHKIYLDIEKAGEHIISFSMREDGFEFDKWLMTREREFERPVGVGPESRVRSGELPKPFPFVNPEKEYPPHWGAPPLAQTRDLRPLPGGYGMGSSTLAKWIQQNLDRDAASSPVAAEDSLLMKAKLFAAGTMKNYYVDRNKWLAVNPEEHKEGAASATFPFPTGKYDVTLRAVGESDGRSTYQVTIDGDELGGFKCPLSKEMFEEGKPFHKTWKGVAITDGAIIKVESQIGSEDGAEFSRARWESVAFKPSDAATQAKAQPLLAKQAADSSSAVRRAGSPTKPVSDKPLIEPRKPHGDGAVTISGERKLWHNVTLTLDGPYAHEQDNEPNPFTDYRMSVLFSHESGKKYLVPGYFAADGDAKNTSAESGTKWRAHFAPDRTGKWMYAVSFGAGRNTALDATLPAKRLTPFDGKMDRSPYTRPISPGEICELTVDCSMLASVTFSLRALASTF